MRACRRIFETCCRLADEGVVPSFDRLMLEFDEPAIKNLLVGIDEAAQATGQAVGRSRSVIERTDGDLSTKGDRAAASRTDRGPARGRAG